MQVHKNKSGEDIKYAQDPLYVSTLAAIASYLTDYTHYLMPEKAGVNLIQVHLNSSCYWC